MKWEYLILVEIRSDAEETQAYLDTFGDEGWELASVSDGWIYLKRPARGGGKEGDAYEQSNGKF